MTGEMCENLRYTQLNVGFKVGVGVVMSSQC